MNRDRLPSTKDLKRPIRSKYLDRIRLQKGDAQGKPRLNLYEAILVMNEVFTPEGWEVECKMGQLTYVYQHQDGSITVSAQAPCTIRAHTQEGVIIRSALSSHAAKGSPRDPGTWSNPLKGASTNAFRHAVRRICEATGLEIMKDNQSQDYFEELSLRGDLFDTAQQILNAPALETKQQLLQAAQAQLVNMQGRYAWMPEWMNKIQQHVQNNQNNSDPVKPQTPGNIELTNEVPKDLQQVLTPLEGYPQLQELVTQTANRLKHSLSQEDNNRALSGLKQGIAQWAAAQQGEIPENIHKATQRAITWCMASMPSYP